MTDPAPKAPSAAKGFSAQGAGGKAASPLMSREAGNAVTNAVADIVNQTAAPFQNLAPPTDVFDAFAKAQACVGAVAGLANAPTEFLNNAFARLTDPIAKVYPSLPAAVSPFSLVLGIPHTHTHPPAMPPPLPAMGTVLTACPTVMICGFPAARSGDFGVGATCGAVTPIFEIFTGSSKVFIGGSRAARVLDMTRECVAAPPAGAAAGAVSKMGKAMAAANKVLGGVAKVSKVMGIAGAGLKVLDKMGDADAAAGKSAAASAAAAAAASAEDATAEATAEADEAAAAAKAEAISAAAEAVASGIAAAAMGANLAMDAAKAAMGKLMGKDPGAPPCMGFIMVGVPTVLIGGFPMPSWSDIAKGLKKLMAMIARGRRGGAAKGKWFCSDCM